MSFKKIIDSDVIFGTLIFIFIFSIFAVTSHRNGKDLRVGLFGVNQVFFNKSPYDNPTDIDRPLFRYAPGFTILQYPYMLQSRMYQPFKFVDLKPSIQAWYWTEIIALLLSALILLKIIPSPNVETSVRNLKLSFLAALPLIAYELVNGQNKIIALFFMLLAVFLFEKDWLFLSSLSFAVALTIYIPLIFFVLYFLLRRKKWFIVNFAAAFIIVFFVIPYIVFGVKFYNYLLKEWFMRTLKPFSLTTSYESYIDLRASSQALPSAIGRLLGFGRTWQFYYLLPPFVIHLIIRILSALIVFFSCLAVWNQPKPALRGLACAIFLTLALILPQYCIYYTWSWLFVFYFAALNYISYPEVAPERKKFLLITAVVLLIGSYSIAIHALNHFSVLFMATILFWGVSVATLISEKRVKA
ncbi:MAG: glycosyltransferase family 87 protein [Candidatus Omnitrophica bacterium]|nr:glycosyltransferase family 87 protein [Candidatus Omnitrophota bacterium]